MSSKRDGAALRLTHSSTHSVDKSDSSRSSIEDEEDHILDDPQHSNILSTRSPPSALPNEYWCHHGSIPQPRSFRVGSRTYGTRIAIGEEQQNVRHDPDRSRTFHSGTHEDSSGIAERRDSLYRSNQNISGHHEGSGGWGVNEILGREERLEHRTVLDSDNDQAQRGWNDSLHSNIISNNRSLPSTLPSDYQRVSQPRSFRVGGRTYTRITIGEQQEDVHHDQGRSRAFRDDLSSTAERRDNLYRSSPDLSRHHERMGEVASGVSNEMFEGREGQRHRTVAEDSDNGQTRRETSTYTMPTEPESFYHSTIGGVNHPSSSAISVIFGDFQFAQTYGTELSRLIGFMDASERSRKYVNEIKKLMPSESSKTATNPSEPSQTSARMNMVTNAGENSNVNQEDDGKLSLADIKAARRRPRRRFKTKASNTEKKKGEKPSPDTTK